MQTIFVSYRHDDSFASAKLLVEHLGRWLPDAEFFIDESGIQAGAEWRATLRDKLDQAQAVLVVIGPRWTTIEDRSGARRLSRAARSPPPARSRRRDRRARSGKRPPARRGRRR